MVSRILRTKGDIDEWTKLLRTRRLPLSVSAVSGKHRTIEQNKLQRLWCNEVAEQLGDRTPEEVRGYSKLHFGVPILRAENEDFCAKYDAVVKPLPYEAKLAIMMEPLDLPVTRLMNTSQKHRYLEDVHRHFSEMGCRLTEPDPLKARQVETA